MFQGKKMSEYTMLAREKKHLSTHDETPRARNSGGKNRTFQSFLATWQQGSPVKQGQSLNSYSIIQKTLKWTGLWSTSSKVLMNLVPFSYIGRVQLAQPVPSWAGLKSQEEQHITGGKGWNSWKVQQQQRSKVLTAFPFLSFQTGIIHETG